MLAKAAPRFLEMKEQSVAVGTVIHSEIEPGDPLHTGFQPPIGQQSQPAIARCLFAVLDRFEQVRAVLWGHVHQEIDQRRNGVRLIASPSTCIQFEPGSEDFKVGEQAPGYRWLRLLPDGGLDTGVERVTGFEFTVDYGSNGY